MTSPRPVRYEDFLARRDPTLDIFQGFSRVMIWPAARVKRSSKCRGSSRVGSGGVRILTGCVGSGQEVVRISRVEPGQHDTIRPARSDTTRQKPRRFPIPPDPTRLDPRGFENLLIRPVGRVMTRENPWLFSAVGGGDAMCIIRLTAISKTGPHFFWRPCKLGNS